MDIWKDFLGRTTKAQLSNLNLESKKADLQTKIAIKNFEIQMRRLYWSLVANNESLKISDELLKSANSLLAESKKRFQNSIAEKDEVARYEALVAQRKGSILLLEFQRENLIQTLKLALPELGTDIQLGQYNIDDTITKVLACTETISSEASTPNHFTSYDELAEMLKTIKENQKTVTSRYDDTNALLFGSVKATGTSSNPNGANEYNGSLSNAFSDLSNNKRSGFLVGLNITIPLGDAKNRTQSVKEAYDRLSLDSEIEKIQSNNNATHSQLVKSIRILNEVLRAQKINSAQLKIRIDGVRKKYIQARASVDDLINDQDSLLSSELTTIETRLKILNTIFDYLTVFNETPCDFNRI
jgi:outer membrane protein TolC